jgi:hypothetical protein
LRHVIIQAFVQIHSREILYEKGKAVKQFHTRVDECGGKLVERRVSGRCGKDEAFRNQESEGAEREGSELVGEDEVGVFIYKRGPP